MTPASEHDSFLGFLEAQYALCRQRDDGLWDEECALCADHPHGVCDVCAIAIAETWVGATEPRERRVVFAERSGYRRCDCVPHCGLWFKDGAPLCYDDLPQPPEDFEP